ncbi:MAG: hypothetical protein QOF69_132 [Solirubrobacteraceae bacterium]|nr:hypothetical protein [Solirubrobacteraceae bacterium]
MREEYPDPSGNTPSHREDLVHDLIALGATRVQILGCRPAEVTASVVTETLALMFDAATDWGDVKVLTILRPWRRSSSRCVRRVLEAHGVAVRRRRRPVALLRRAPPQRGARALATASDSSDTHSGRLGACLKRLLDGDAAVEQFHEVEEQAIALRLRFDGQFACHRR